MHFDIWHINVHKCIQGYNFGRPVCLWRKAAGKRRGQVFVPTRRKTCFLPLETVSQFI